MSSHSNPIRPRNVEGLYASDDESEVVMDDGKGVAAQVEQSDVVAGSAEKSDEAGGAPEFDESAEADKPAMMKAPYQPSAKEVANHNPSHFPRGLRVKGGYADSTVTTVNMDYCYLKQDVSTKSPAHEESSKARTSMTVLVMQDIECASVWAYVVETK